MKPSNTFTDCMAFKVVAGLTTTISGVSPVLDGTYRDNTDEIIQPNTSPSNTEKLTSTTAKNTDTIKDGSNLVITPTTGDTVVLGKNGDNSRISSPEGSSYSINMNGKNVNVQREETANSKGENTTIIKVNKSTFTLYNYVQGNSSETPAVWGDFGTRSANFRVEPDIEITNGGIFKCAPAELLTGKITIKGPDKDNISNLNKFLSTDLEYIKQGAIGFSGTGGSVKLSSNVELTGVKGITCQKPRGDTQTTIKNVPTALEENAIINVSLSDGASIRAIGDNHSGYSSNNEKRNDIAGGVYLVAGTYIYDNRGNLTSSSNIAESISVSLYDNSSISATSSVKYDTLTSRPAYDNGSLGIFVQYGKAIKIELKDDTSITAYSPEQGGYGIYLDNCSGSHTIDLGSGSKITTCESPTSEKLGTAIYLNNCGTDNTINIESFSTFEGCLNFLTIEDADTRVTVNLPAGTSDTLSGRGTWYISNNSIQIR
ncbi:MAG: hypothetical protein KBS81_09550 [Spirochaetales bacterium]|nr:hypothetical protein [Candidatus Physcosoma equi]